jgi:hypothetical protein
VAAADPALWVREAVLAGEPDLTERVYRGWHGIGFWYPDAGYVRTIYPREQEQAVRLLFEHGVRLDDPEGLLEGAGTQTRFSACGSATTGLLWPSVGMSMPRWRSGRFDGSGPAHRLPGMPLTDRTAGHLLRGCASRELPWPAEALVEGSGPVALPARRLCPRPA